MPNQMIFTDQAAVDTQQAWERTGDDWQLQPLTDAPAVEVTPDQQRQLLRRILQAELLLRLLGL